jgi:hypothetical protein
MDDERSQVRILLANAADTAGRFAPPELEQLLAARPVRSRRQPVLLAVASAAAVVAIAVGLSVSGGSRRPGADASPMPSSTASSLALPGPTGGVGVTDLQGYRWRQLPDAPIVPRSNAASAWIGRELLVWGGDVGGKEYRDDGAVYDPATRSWSELPPAPISARTRAKSVWVGGRFVVWGGSLDGGASATDGAAYDPTTRRWTKLPAAPIRGSGSVELVAAHGEAVLLSSGPNSSVLTVAAYDPVEDFWRRLPELALPSGHVIGWIFGVGAGDTVVAFPAWSQTIRTSASSFSIKSGVAGYTLDVTHGGWSRTPMRPDKTFDQVIWTGQQILLLGGGIWCGPCSHPPELVSQAYSADPHSGRQDQLPTAPTSPETTAYVWTGSALLGVETVKGTTGQATFPAAGTTAAWNPTTNAWTRLEGSDITGDASGAVLAWTGKELLLWGVAPTGNTDILQPSGYELRPPGS